MHIFGCALTFIYKYSIIYLELSFKHKKTQEEYVMELLLGITLLAGGLFAVAIVVLYSIPTKARPNDKSKGGEGTSAPPPNSSWAERFKAWRSEKNAPFGWIAGTVGIVLVYLIIDQIMNHDSSLMPIQIGYSSIVPHIWPLLILMVLGLIINGFLGKKGNETLGIVLGAGTFVIVALLLVGWFSSFSGSSASAPHGSTGAQTPEQSGYNPESIAIPATENKVSLSNAKFKLLPGQRTKRVDTEGKNFTINYPGLEHGKKVLLMLCYSGKKQLVFDRVGVAVAVGHPEWVVVINSESDQAIQVEFGK